MEVFLTGATGYVGSVVTQKLLVAGHGVTGLARNEEGAAKLRERGIKIAMGDLKQPDTLIAPARQADGVIHCGFVHDFSDYQGMMATERGVLAMFADTLAGSGKPLRFHAGDRIPSGHRHTTGRRNVAAKPRGNILHTGRNGNKIAANGRTRHSGKRAAPAAVRVRKRRKRVRFDDARRGPSERHELLHRTRHKRTIHRACERPGRLVRAGPAKRARRFGVQCHAGT